MPPPALVLLQAATGPGGLDAQWALAGLASALAAVAGAYAAELRSQRNTWMQRADDGAKELRESTKTVGDLAATVRDQTKAVEGVVVVANETAERARHAVTVTTENGKRLDGLRDRIEQLTEALDGERPAARTRGAR